MRRVPAPTCAVQQRGATIMKQYVNMGLIAFAGTLAGALIGIAAGNYIMGIAIGTGVGAGLGYVWTQPASR
jgi:uncharacterized membrane protein